MLFLLRKVSKIIIIENPKWRNQSPFMLSYLKKIIYCFQHKYDNYNYIIKRPETLPYTCKLHLHTPGSTLRTARKWLLCKLRRNKMKNKKTETKLKENTKQSYNIQQFFVYLLISII